ncbi:MAG: hypothetical protein RLZZ164_244 [Actinomycetota bacterium]|jgi:hypothetical protein
MDYVTTSHRFATEIIARTEPLNVLYQEILDAISALTDEALIEEFQSGEKGPAKSLSYAINALLRKELHDKRGWLKEAEIFQGAEYKNVWRLDFLKQTVIAGAPDDADDNRERKSGMAVEVAFNHGEAIAWNILKPVLASEINHIHKNESVDIGAGVGIVITATAALKSAGSFDNAVGEYEKVLRYLIPMHNQLTVPMVLIGLKAPKSFRLEAVKNPVTGRSESSVVLI